MGYKLNLDEPKIAYEYLSGKNFSEIAKLIGCSKGTIRNILIRNNIKIRSLSDALKSKRNTALSSNQKQIIEGLLLGDGSVLRRGATPYFRLKSIQKEFVHHVKAMFPFDFNDYTEKPCTRIINGRECNCKRSYTIESPVDNALENYRNSWYVNNVKIIPRDLTLTPIICKYWFYSDGWTCYTNKTKKCVRIGLCTDCFTKDECLFLREQLLSIGFEFKIAKTAMGYYRLHAEKKDSVNGFLDYMGNPDLKCYRYKWKKHNGTRPYRGH